MEIESPDVRCRILGVELNSGSIESFLDRIFELSDKKSGGYACFVNTHMLVEAHEKPEFRRIVNAADINCPDGMPIAKLVSITGRMRQPKISGPDMLPLIMERASEENKRLFILGGTNDLIVQFIEKAKARFGDIVSGYNCPPFRKLSKVENNRIVEEIEASNADFVFVSLGCPKQEKWMHEHRRDIKAFMLGVGYAIPVFAGVAGRAPVWMQKAGLEWLFRLIQNPQGLWKRYMYTNAKLAVLVLGLCLRRKVKLDA